jgi:hypothetical protein
MEIADWMTDEAGAVSVVKVDGQPEPFSLSGSVLTVPGGTGTHTIEIEFKP